VFNKVFWQWFIRQINCIVTAFASCLAEAEISNWNLWHRAQSTATQSDNWQEYFTGIWRPQQAHGQGDFSKFTVLIVALNTLRHPVNCCITFSAADCCCLRLRPVESAEIVRHQMVPVCFHGRRFLFNIGGTIDRLRRRGWTPKAWELRRQGVWGVGRGFPLPTGERYAPPQKIFRLRISKWWVLMHSVCFLKV